MAISNTTVWEIRQTGSALNGGGFRPGSGGTDYSQQAAAQLSLTDVVTNGTTTLTSAVGGFTAAMVGNVAMLYTADDHPSYPGLPLVYERFDIISRTSANAIVVDRIPSFTLTAWRLRVGGALRVGEVGPVGPIMPPNFLAQGIVPGNTIHVTGSHSFTSAPQIIGPFGSAALPIKVVGYNTTRGDDPVGASRPTIGSELFRVGALWWFSNIHFNWKGYAGSGCVFRNCLFDEPTGQQQTVNSRSLASASDSLFIDCEFDGGSPPFGASHPYALTPSVACLLGCYYHDLSPLTLYPSGQGVGQFLSGSVMRHCVVANSGPPFFSPGSNSHIFGNTFYNTGVLSGNTGVLSGETLASYRYGHVKMNNIVSPPSQAIAPHPYRDPLCDYNNWSGVGASTMLEYSRNSTGVAPQFRSPVGEDFRLLDGSGCLGSGFANRLGG